MEQEPKIEKTMEEELKEISDELFSLGVRLTDKEVDIDRELRRELNLAFNNIRQRLGKYYSK